jgi:hypothetical protein
MSSSSIHWLTNPLPNVLQASTNNVRLVSNDLWPRHAKRSVATAPTNAQRSRSPRWTEEVADEEDCNFEGEEKDLFNTGGVAVVAEVVVVVVVVVVADRCARNDGGEVVAEVVVVVVEATGLLGRLGLLKLFELFEL